MSAAAFPTDRYGWLAAATVIAVLTAVATHLLQEWAGLFLLGTAVAPVVVFALFRYRGLVAYGFTLLSILAVDNDPGINLREAIFYLYMIGCAGILTPYILVSGQWKINQNTDKVLIVFLIFILYGFGFSFFTGASMMERIKDMVYFTPFFVYPVLRHHMHNDKVIRNIAIILILIITAIAIRNFMNYQQLLLNAVMEWQVQKARVAKNEVYLLFGSVAFFVLQAYQTKWVPRLITLGFFGLFLGALVLTQSRGYWLAFFFAAGIFFLLSKGDVRIRALLTSSVLGSFAVLLAFLFYYDAMVLFIENMAHRISLTSKGIDVSLQERVHETAVALQMIAQNPIAGYGIGYEYSRYGVITGFHTHTTYFHNGYLAMWIKFGLLGLVVSTVFWGSIIRTGFQMYQKSEHSYAQIWGLIITCQICGMMLVNLTSPQFLGLDSTILLSILAAITSSMADLYPPSDKPQSTPA